jgi:hypothetical protein
MANPAQRGSAPDDDSWGKIASDLFGIQFNDDDDFELPDDEAPVAEPRPVTSDSGASATVAASIEESNSEAGTGMNPPSQRQPPGERKNRRDVAVGQKHRNRVALSEKNHLAGNRRRAEMNRLVVKNHLGGPSYLELKRSAVNRPMVSPLAEKNLRVVKRNGANKRNDHAVAQSKRLRKQSLPAMTMDLRLSQFAKNHAANVHLVLSNRRGQGESRLIAQCRIVQRRIVPHLSVPQLNVPHPRSDLNPSVDRNAPPTVQKREKRLRNS